MTAKVLFCAHRRHFEPWSNTLQSALAQTGVRAQVDYKCGDPASYGYVIFSPDGPIRDFSRFTRLKAVLSLWAGVETLVINPTIRCTITRMVDPGMIEGMTEWVVGQVLRYHLRFDEFLGAAPGVWLQHLRPPLARHRTITICGLGQLGTSAALALAALNFRMIGWSRTQRQVDGVDCRSGGNDLEGALSEADIVVLMMPHTAETEDMFSSRLFRAFRPGSVLINCGRGALIVDDDLTEALDHGPISHATLDVFRNEPLPPKHPFWRHPKISVWPHISSETRVSTAARVIAENIRRGESGEPLLHVVDRKRGY